MNPIISGPFVRAAREAANLSQNAVAQALSMNRMYYSLYEAGRYVLNEAEQAALRDFLHSRGIGVELVEGDKATGSFSSSLPVKNPELGEGDKASRFRASRIEIAAMALSAVTSTSKYAGVDSKRTATTIAAAASALQILDYAELLDLVEELGGSLEGLADESSFSRLPVEQKQVWESRAAGMLVCAALYGEAWTQAGCSKLRMVRGVIRKRIRDDQWNVRECGLFESDESYLPDLRCHLAPYVAMAAEQRCAPLLD